MSIFSNILDIIVEIKKNNYLNIDDKRKPIFTSVGRSSISKKSLPAVLQFPVLTSNTISIQDLTMVNKALERQYATFVRIAMGLDDLVDFKNVSSKEEYIKKFHQNMGEKIPFGSTIDKVEEILSDSMNSANLIALKPYSEENSLGIRMDSLNDKTNKRNNNYYVLKNEDQLFNPGAIDVESRETTERSDNRSSNSKDWEMSDPTSGSSTVKGGKGLLPYPPVSAFHIAAIPALGQFDFLPRSSLIAGNFISALLNILKIFPAALERSALMASKRSSSGESICSCCRQSSSRKWRYCFNSSFCWKNSSTFSTGITVISGITKEVVLLTCTLSRSIRSKRV